MTDNPLLNRARAATQAHTDGTHARLLAHVEKLNNYPWIRIPGKLYFVAGRTLADGRIEHFVDRHQ